MNTRTVSLCHHSFPCQPPHGSIFRPGDCTRCGITFAQLQIELAQQETDLRVGTAHEARCTSCGRHRMLFRYQRGSHPWETEDPPTHWLCTPCWGNADEAEEATGFTDFNDAFANATDEQLNHFVFGGTQ